MTDTLKLRYAMLYTWGKISYRKGVGGHREAWAEPLLNGTKISFCGRSSKRGFQFWSNKLNDPAFSNETYYNPINGKFEPNYLSNTYFLCLRVAEYHFQHSLPDDTTIMVLKNYPIIVSQQVTIATARPARNTLTLFVTKMITTCTPLIIQRFFYAMVLASSDEKW